MEIYVAVKLR